MCYGFGAVMLKDGRMFFCEPTWRCDVSHDLILNRLTENKICTVKSLGLTDEYYINPKFVRFESPDWTTDSSIIDRNMHDYDPDWLQPEKALRKFNRLLEKVQPIYQNFRLELLNLGIDIEDREIKLTFSQMDLHHTILKKYVPEFAKIHGYVGYKFLTEGTDEQI